MRSRRFFLIVLFASLAVLLTSCGPYTIDDFYVSSGCTGEGTLAIQSKNDDISTWGTIQVSGSDMRYWTWCHGLIHEWKGTSMLKGYTIESDSSDPLRFILDKDKGYYYQQGTGTITTPDGKETTFP